MHTGQRCERSSLGAANVERYHLHNRTTCWTQPIIVNAIDTHLCSLQVDVCAVPSEHVIRSPVQRVTPLGGYKASSDTPFLL
jgi:hypothetical protein